VNNITDAATTTTTNTTTTTTNNNNNYYYFYSCTEWNGGSVLGKSIAVLPVSVSKLGGTSDIFD
jgi:hypothetical protein